MTENSQNIPLLAPAVNLDPNPSIGGGGIIVAEGAALVPQEGPSGTAADIETQPSNSQISIYIVRDGDTLSSIASMFGVSVNTIVGANDINKDVIHPGQELIILPITGIQHTVLKGETLASLAAKYNSNAHDIAAYNSLADNEALTVGQTVIIPNVDMQYTTPPSSGSGSSSTSAATTAKPKTAENKFVPAPLRGTGGVDQTGYYTWPVAGGVITQGLHGFDAVDIGAPKGTDIYAAAAGTVIIAKDNGAWNGGYGNYIVIQHNNGSQTLYAHASAVLVSQGDQVTQGQLIAKVGMTGEATGNHLHFEVRGAKNPFGNLPVGTRE